MRQHYVQSYLDGDITLQYLRQCAPFLARELSRQQLTKKRLSKVMGQHA
jgi:hypothetical protein